MSELELEPEPEDLPQEEEFPGRSRRRSTRGWLYPCLVVASFLLGLLTSSVAWGGKPATAAANSQPIAGDSAGATGQGKSTVNYAALIQEVNPPQGYKLPATYGDLGPRLLEGGAIDYEKFAAVFQSGGEPLTNAEIQALKSGSSEPILINADNAHFLLNFFWAVGLANKNTILTQGPMMQNSNGQIENFASTGGWTLASKPVKDVYASLALISLTPEQQARVEQVAAAVYRPCCGNPTLFPDCNHGMAMLGLLELMASQNASAEQMFAAAKYVNAYWFPQQALETAIFLKAKGDVDFAGADARVIVAEQFSSATGSGQLHAMLQSEGLLPSAPNNGGGCGT